MATAMLGGVAVPVNWHFTAEESAYVLNDCDAKVLVIHADLWRKLGPEMPKAITDTLTVVVVETPAISPWPAVYRTIPERFQRG